ncbi:MAG: hypothetical protein LJE84_10000 [Gammaproteobacteria bacterium]|jgi:hypothetical protein|nr:hypothetical protein [Gammaproteobacteria bacterium]
MFSPDYLNVDWWYLLACAFGLSLGLAGWGDGFLIAIAFAAFQLIHAIAKHRALTAFPVQVRTVYTLILVVALNEPMQWLYWLPAAGTWAVVLFDYCPLARILALAPFNSRGPLSIAQVRATFLARPTHNILASA